MAGMDPFTAGFNALSLIIDKLFPDPEKAAQAKLLLLSQEMAPLMAQLDINKEEAKSPSMFVAGGRPFILWVCGLSLAWNYLLVPIVMYGAYATGHAIPKPPTLLDDHLWELITGMLGLGVMRSMDKRAGVDTKDVALK